MANRDGRKRTKKSYQKKKVWFGLIGICCHNMTKQEYQAIRAYYRLHPVKNEWPDIEVRRFDIIQRNQTLANPVEKDLGYD